jgi:hypothetical protein
MAYSMVVVEGRAVLLGKCGRWVKEKFLRFGGKGRGKVLRGDVFLAGRRGCLSHEGEAAFHKSPSHPCSSSLSQVVKIAQRQWSLRRFSLA